MKGTSPSRGCGGGRESALMCQDEVANVHRHQREGKSMPIVTIGIDLAKNVFAVHGVDATGKAMLIKPRVPRDQLATLIAQLPACLVGMEAWLRCASLGMPSSSMAIPSSSWRPTLWRLIACRASEARTTRRMLLRSAKRWPPSMRFVPLKDEHQQAMLCLQRTRQGFVEERTATYNRLRGLLSKFGVVLPQSPEKLRRYVTEHLHVARLGEA